MIIKIPLKCNEDIVTIDWQAEKTKVPGLVVHKTIDLNGNKEPVVVTLPWSTRFYWTISHQETGRFVIDQIETKKLALQVAEKLGKLDWTKTIKTKKEAMPYKRLRDKIIKEFGL